MALEGGVVAGMEAVEAKDVKLTSAVEAGEVGQLLAVGAAGSLKGAGAGLKYDDADGGTLTVAKLGAFKATGPIDFDNQPLQNMRCVNARPCPNAQMLRNCSWLML